MVSDEALKKLQEQIAAWPMTQRFVVQQLIEDYRMDREDLRAYKATGLTPEEVERSKLEIEAGCVKAIARTYGIDINRLRKLAEADRDGRVVAPVVRCMDCKHLVAVNVNGKGIPTCRVSGMEVAPDEFCSRGEKGRR